MNTNTNSRLKLVLFLSLFLKILCFSFGADTISIDDVLSGDSTIVSASRVFEMGFFRPGSAPNYYLGIWYQKDTSRRAVWVANRDKPVSLSSELRISDGNLVLFDESKLPIWSTNVSSSSTNSRSVQAVLLDAGNLVLNDESNPLEPLWQSFDYPSHTWLPGAKLGYNKITNTSQIITSWKNLEDPAPGIYSFQLDQNDNSIVVVWNRSRVSWTSGPWDGQIFSRIPEMKLNYNFIYSFVSNENESYITYDIKNTSTMICNFEMGVLGQINQMNWLPINEWSLFWSLPQQQCEVYDVCGAYGSCKSNEKSLPFCQCLTGYEPKSPRDWELKDYSDGCFRGTKLQCETNSSNGTPDRFLEMADMSTPENKYPVEARSYEECELRCLQNCSCSGVYYDSSGCSMWSGDLVNLRQLEAGESSRRTLYIRLAASEFRKPKRLFGKWKLYVLLFGIIAVAMFTSLIARFICIQRRKKAANKQANRSNMLGNRALRSYGSENHIKDFITFGRFREDEKKGIPVPFVALEKVLAATDNFSEDNKLGQGGFGPVYKGKFLEGQEIAIKRLSSGSGQGLEEFKTEILLIAKLQHRNLVRLLGYCAERNEQILLYEYMPNKSLDRFLFDQNLCVLLNWKIRFNIILGIARGLLYLHHDSRLRIIHRDLKTSNVLLDEEMNPKISDFGLARIFGGKQTQASTNRVVGTYGYMSPEYALDGLFSIKSDVFSFGVVTLEIITGEKNTRFYQSEQSLSLISYAWKLWNDNAAMELMDATLGETCNANEFLRCVTIGLLCVQDDPNDRPTMSNVIVMLGSETGSLPSPKQPAFVVRRSLSSTTSSSKPSSNNGLTDTLNQGR
ncbi:S-receptor-like serine/threonine-protein kinase [Parasponia andersonii]|uniref:Receptor-like serine/threonine-protein kinase n=1 Tax=Parasponia andersonii TaxID=3476 RepID=A0A2P5E4L5_PARAD|nr:S-receptor-like serine/threonine-protein kinase [Parasponia andersonii]